MEAKTLIFTPPKSIEPFLLSEEFINLVVGPVGSTKTTASLIKIAYHAKRMAPCYDGIRRSRVAVIRNTRSMLYDSTVPDFLKWFPENIAGSFIRTESKFVLRFDDVECEVLFRWLDTPDDVRRLLSMQLSFGVMDEFREIHSDVFNALQGRLGRYPDKLMVPPRPEWGVDDKGHPIGGCVLEDGKPAKCLWGASNPPDYGTFWEEYLSNPPANARVFFQPSAFSPEADWLHVHSPNYYEDLAEGKSQDWIDVYIHGKFGRSQLGEPVHKSFDRTIHVAKEPLKPLPTAIVVGFDAGLTPAAVLTQQTYDGRILVLDELTSSGMGALRFCREKLKPLLANKYLGYRVTVAPDPAAYQRAQTDERTAVDILKAEGFNVQRPARNNAFAARVAALDGFLTRVVDGKPAFLVSPSCVNLIQGLGGKYRYKQTSNGETKEPVKDEWSHVVESLHYACLLHNGGVAFGTPFGVKRREVKPAPFRWF